MAEKEEVISRMRKEQEEQKDGLEKMDGEMEVLKEALEQKEAIVKEYMAKAEEL